MNAGVAALFFFHRTQLDSFNLLTFAILEDLELRYPDSDQLRTKKDLPAFLTHNLFN